MGFRVQLIAVTGKEPGAIHRDLRVVPTGEREEIAESPVVGAVLPNGAYLLYINDPDKITPNDKIYARLSKGGALVACYANETVMDSYACGWVNGVERWSVYHGCQPDIKHLQTSGALPPEFQPIRDRLFEEMEGSPGRIDFIFDIPVELFDPGRGHWCAEDLARDRRTRPPGRPPLARGRFRQVHQDA